MDIKDNEQQKRERKALDTKSVEEKINENASFGHQMCRRIIQIRIC